MEGDFPFQLGEILQELWIQMLHLVKKRPQCLLSILLTLYITFLKASLTYSDTPGVDDCCVPTEVMPIG